jgi:hypothetical protein
MRVYRWNLFLMLHSFLADKPTRGERVAATYILARTPNRRGTGMNTPTEIATTLGISRAEVWNALEDIRHFREVRHRRRLADVGLRELRRQRAIDAGRQHDRSGHAWAMSDGRGTLFTPNGCRRCGSLERGHADSHRYEPPTDRLRLARMRARREAS